MTQRPDSLLSALRRSDFPNFLRKSFETLHPNGSPLAMQWYILALCHALTGLGSGDNRRLVVTVPPRHLKSITAAVAYTAWLLGHDPTIKIMVASYSQDLARLHSNMTRSIMESDWYKRDFPNTRISDRGNRANELVTTAGGGRKAVSVGGSITGFGADVIIVDDCMKADEARSQAVRDEVRGWFDNTLITRLNNKATGIVFSIAQRLHESDLPAHLLEKGYPHLNLPSIAEKEELIPIGNDRFHLRRVGDLLNPEREPKAILDQIRRDLGAANFAAQHQQDPVAPEGNMIRMEWFGSYAEAPERHQFLKVVQSWDTGMSAAITSDPSVCTTWGFEREQRKWYLLDVFRQRMDFPELKRAVIRQAARWVADAVLIEDAGSGKSLWQEFRTSGPLTPIMITPIQSKEDRFNGCLAEVEAGNILLPVDAAWLDAFRHELKAFPSGQYDDQVDSFSQFVNYQLRNWKWVITEYTRDGRALQIVRHRKRPW